MSKTRTPEQLYIVALQDLHDAEQAWCERGPALRAAARDEVRLFLAEQIERSTRHVERLAALIEQRGADVDGDPNIWLRAILDDAARDDGSIVAGSVRDTALVGAFRKGKQAGRVSYETAIALAGELKQGEDSDTLRHCRDEEADADAALAALLAPKVAS